MIPVGELSDTVSDQARPVPRTSWRSDPSTVALRLSIILCALGGVSTTIRGVRAAWSTGVPHEGLWAEVVQQTWGVTPFVLLVLISLFPISKRSLATVLVTTLLAWFMSTGYWSLEEMGLMVLVIPFIQIVFILGGLSVMFTFWLLRKRNH